MGRIKLSARVMEARAIAEKTEAKKSMSDVVRDLRSERRQREKLAYKQAAAVATQRSST